MLLVHAPYPGQLKFDAQPSSLMTAAGPLVRSLAAEGRLEEVGYLDPGAPTAAFYRELEHLTAGGGLQVVCVSTSTAAIEEARRIARVVREAAPQEVLIVGGGPHEDDIDEPMAERLPEFDLSIAGDAEDALGVVCLAALRTERGAARALDFAKLLSCAPLRGSGRVARAGNPRWAWSAAEKSAVEEIITRPWAAKPVHFSVFPGRTTLPLMVSRGCPYGQCTFCAEGSSGGQRTTDAFHHLVPLLDAHPGSALYFQDSIFPSTRAVRERLLPLLGSSGRPWGCQVYLPTLSRSFTELLAAYGCTYVYTGLESGSEVLRSAVGKPGLGASLASERLRWISDQGMGLGLSLMFGVIDSAGALLETEQTVGETVRFVEGLVGGGLEIAGIYPNVLTVLPGTRLARALAVSGAALDFYRVPRTTEFEDLEDGAVGYNFVTLGFDRDQRLRTGVVEASKHLSSLGGRGTAPQVASTARERSLQ